MKQEVEQENKLKKEGKIHAGNLGSHKQIYEKQLN